MQLQKDQKLDWIGPISTSHQLQLHAFKMSQPIWTKPIAYVILLLNTDILSQFWSEMV